MKIKQLLTKTLLVAVGLLAGQSVWAETYLTTMTGKLESGDFQVNRSKRFTIAKGESLTYTFVNTSVGAAVYNNWVVEARDATTNYCCDMRGDAHPGGEHSGVNAGAGYWTWDDNKSKLSGNYTGSKWSDIDGTSASWLSAYNGVTVTLTIEYSSDGSTLTMTHSATVNASDYSGTYTVTGFEGNNINVFLSNEWSTQTINKVVYTNASSVTTSYVLRDCASSITAVGTTTYGTDGSGNSSTIRLNSYAAQGGAGAFAFTLDEDWDASKVIGATLSFYPISKCNNSKRSGSINIHSLDAYPVVSATSTSYSEGKHIVYSHGGNNTKRYTFSTTTLATVDANGANTGVPAQGAYYDIDLTSHIQSLTTKSAGDYVYLGIDIDDWAADITIGAYGNDYAPKMEIAYTTATLYTATFTETNSLSPEVTIYSDAGMTSPVTNGTLENGTTYYYKAVLYGYNDVTGNFTVSSTDPSINFAMTAKETYNYSLKYKLGTADAVEQASGTKYVDETVTLYYPICRQDASSNYYVVSKNNSAPYFGVVISSSNNDVTINYTLDEDIVYYSESENMDGTRYSVGQAASYSSNGASYCSYASENSYIATNWTVAAGYYDIEVGMANRNYAVNPTPKLMTSSTDENPTTLEKISLSSSSYKQKIYPNQQIAAGQNLYIFNDNGSNPSKWALDYVIMRRIPASVNVNITAAGWATLYSPYALNFAEANPSSLKAYTATTDGVSVTLTPVSDVPANTGVVLEGSAGNYSIPVIASSGTDKGGLQGSATEATTCPAETGFTYYILTLAQNGVDVQFNPATSGSIAEGKAFLKVATDNNNSGGAKALSVMFANDPTGIANVNAAEVAQPIKRIVNGQLVIEKNGKRFNAAGAEF